MPFWPKQLASAKVSNRGRVGPVQELFGVNRILFVISIWGVPNRDIVFAPQNFFCTVQTHCYCNQIDISFSGGPSQSWPGMCMWGGNVQVLCITQVTCESHVPSHSHAIWMKLRVRGAFGFGWHYLESKYNFDCPFLFLNSTLFQTQILFQQNMTLAGILRYQLVPEQALNYKERCHKYCKKVENFRSHVTKKNTHHIGEFE